MNLQENDSNVEPFASTNEDAAKTYMAETVFKKSESSDENCDEIPKIIIRLKPESKCPEPDFSSSEDLAPLTIADKVKLGRRKNGNFKCEDTEERISVKKMKHKTHKRKSRHKDKKKHSGGKVKSEMPRINETLNGKLSNCNAVCFAEEQLCLSEDSSVNNELNESGILPNSLEQQDNLTSQMSDDDSVMCFKNSPVDDDIFSSNNNNQVADDSEIRLENDESIDRTSEQSLEAHSVDSFQLDFDTVNDLSLSSSVEIKREYDECEDEFLVNTSINVTDGNIPNSNKSIKDSESAITVESSAEDSCCAIPKKEVKTENDGNVEVTYLFL